MFRWNAEVRCEDDENYGHFLFRDLSDSDIIVLGELAERSGDMVSVKFWAEKEAPEDVAYISGMDFDADMELLNTLKKMSPKMRKELSHLLALFSTKLEVKNNG